MYLEYWGLEKYPFENVPDPEFLFYSKEHEEALVRLLYAAKRNKGAALLTGEVGIGKTTLSRAFLQQISNGKFDIALMTNPTLEPIDFLKEVLNQFGLRSDSDSKADILDVLNQRLLENMNKGTTTLLIIDEAQLIFRDTFEEIRLLLNFQMNDSFLLTLILIGQPELREIILGIEQLDQRIAIKYHLHPLSDEDVVNYIGFRLEKAGLAKNPFNQQAVDEIFSFSQGIPRKINNVCDMSLLIGFTAKAEVIDSEIVKKVVDELS